jgi:alkyl hydroperoxide reductase 1
MNKDLSAEPGLDGSYYCDVANKKFANDPGAEFSKALGLDADLGPAFGPRTGRYALVVDNLKISYIGVEDENSAVTSSGYEAVLKAL